ncbi:MAG TPA: hypothetical protein PKL83_00995 [bacterium]|nr:hypothetical protein [bacterium]
MDIDLLTSKVNQAQFRMDDWLRERGYTCSTFWFGAIDIHPKHIGFWIRVKTDAEKQTIEQDAQILPALRDCFRTVGYPAEAIAELGFAVQSDETVDRVFNGNWYHAIK